MENPFIPFGTQFEKVKLFEHNIQAEKERLEALTAQLSESETRLSRLEDQKVEEIHKFKAGLSNAPGLYRAVFELSAGRAEPFDLFNYFNESKTEQTVERIQQLEGEIDRKLVISPLLSFSLKNLHLSSVEHHHRRRELKTSNAHGIAAELLWVAPGTTVDVYKSHDYDLRSGATTKVLSVRLPVARKSSVESRTIGQDDHYTIASPISYEEDKGIKIDLVTAQKSVQIIFAENQMKEELTAGETELYVGEDMILRGVRTRLEQLRLKHRSGGHVDLGAVTKLETILLKEKIS